MHDGVRYDVGASWVAAADVGALRRALVATVPTRLGLVALSALRPGSFEARGPCNTGQLRLAT